MGKQTDEVIRKYEKYVMNTYSRQSLVVTKGKGSRVWDVEGKEYLDLFPGWGVSALGHNHPWVMSALRGQAGRIAHVPNNYYQPLQWRAAKAIVDAAFPGKVFFCNSGAETVETAIKLARRWGASKGCSEIIVMERSFHGRTTGALSATGQPGHQEGFTPLLPGMVHVPFNDLDVLRKAITPKTAAVLLEPIQGEGGVRVASREFLQGVRQLCDDHKLLMMLDEVQTGMGRTGAWFAYQEYAITPDVMLLAKALGGGFPIGAVIAKDSVAQMLPPGTHAATYGGNPLGCACVIAVFETIKKQKLVERVRELSETIFERLQAIQGRCSIVKEVRGRGLMIGLELKIPGAGVVDACRNQRVLINCTQESVLRLLPAMTISKAQLKRGLDVLEKALMESVEKTAVGG